MKTIGILSKPTFPDVTRILRELVTWLREHGKEVAVDGKAAALLGEPAVYTNAQIASLSDLLLVLGGDGTMLNAARLVEERQVPILGVNMGGLGFLTEATIEHLFPTLEKVFANDYLLEERLMLRAHIDRHGEHVASPTVLNDVVVSKGTLARMVEIQILIDGQFVTNLRGDGLIISTPTGSTAYSLSAGGPVVNPIVEGLILTPICPHTLSHRPLVVESKSVIEVILTSHEEGAMATFDGQIGVSLSHGDRIAVRTSDHRAKLVRFPDRTYYEVLRKKLNWGLE
ncbi:MAG: NAD(+)/NADH kinase [Nitrospirales bacterium]